MKNFPWDYVEEVALNIMGGVQDVKQAAFFSDSILAPLDSCWRNISYVFFYANYASDKYWTPLPGQTTADDFAAFAADDRVVMLDDARWQELAYAQGQGGESA